MSSPLEHDYIGLKQSSSSMEKLSSSSSENFKETELRLGLPGSESLERKSASGFSILNMGFEDKLNGYSVSPSKTLISGAKRGFSDSINGSCEKWVFCLSNGSNVDMISGSESDCKNKELCESKAALKEGVNVPKSVKPDQERNAPAAKAQVVGWPPIRSFRKNTMASSLAKSEDDVEGKSGLEGLYVKVSMEGAPYLRKVDLKNYSNYMELSSALEKMFRCFTIGQCSSHGLVARDDLNETRLMDLLHGSEYVLTYEDKDSDWMLVGDVPWTMFIDSCKRLRIMKGSEAIGLAPRAMEKCKNRS